jgi:DNA invertase Pin-like site-specific DNA recombinase
VGLRIDRYIRVSDVKGRGGANFIAPEDQDERIVEWIEGSGHVVGEELRDLDETGGVIDRPAFQLGLERIEFGLSDGFAVHRFDRFARSTRVATEAVARIDAAGGRVFFVAEDLDNHKARTAHGGMTLNLWSMIAQFERDRISESWRTAKMKATSRGVYIGTRIPPGYTKTDDGLLVPNDEAPIAVELFERRRAGASWRELGEWLTSRLGPREGGRLWSGQAVRRLIESRVYRGEVRHGPHENLDAHVPLVSEELWQAAQLARPRPPVGVRGGGLLTGFVRCAGCGYVMRRERSRNRKGWNYTCGGYFAGGRCPAPAGISAGVLEPHVVARWREATGEDAEVRAVEKSDELRAAREEAERRQSALMDFLAYAEDLDPADFRPALEARKRARDEARERVARLGAQLAALGTAGRPWETMTVEQRRQLLDTAIDAVFVRRSRRRAAPVETRVRIRWTGEQPRNDLPGRGRSVPMRSYDALFDGDPVVGGELGA